MSAILHALDRLIEAYKIPTQACCLAHISTQLKAMERGAPLDLLFQSVAGTQKANESFGITLSMLREGKERVLEHHKDRGIGTDRWESGIGNRKQIPLADKSRARNDNTMGMRVTKLHLQITRSPDHPITRSLTHVF